MVPSRCSLLPDITGGGGGSLAGHFDSRNAGGVEVELSDAGRRVTTSCVVKFERKIVQFAKHYKMQGWVNGLVLRARVVISGIPSSPSLTARNKLSPGLD